VSAARYDAGARFFHWLFVLLFLAQVPAGIVMIVPAVVGDFAVLPGVEQTTVDAFYIFHKGLGAVLIVVVFARVLWRLTHPAPPLPDTIPELERRIAGWTHAFMYVLMVVAVVTGYVHVVGLGFPMELLDAIGVPPLIPRMERIAVVSSFVHRFTVFVLVGVVGVHVARGAPPPRGAQGRHSGPDVAPFGRRPDRPGGAGRGAPEHGRWVGSTASGMNSDRRSPSHRSTRATRPAPHRPAREGPGRDCGRSWL
jgi:cytochrome b561